MWQFLVQKDDGKKGSTLTAKKKKKNSQDSPGVVTLSNQSQCEVARRKRLSVVVFTLFFGVVILCCMCVYVCMCSFSRSPLQVIKGEKKQKKHREKR